MSKPAYGRRASDRVEPIPQDRRHYGRRLSDKLEQQSFFKRHLTKFLCEYVPWRIKRLIFLSSVIGFIEGIREPDKEYVQKLNEILKLAHHDDAIALPMYIHSWLWKKCDDEVSIEINGVDAKVTDLAKIQIPPLYFSKIASFLISNAPAWIVYGNVETVAKDLEILFRKKAENL